MKVILDTNIFLSALISPHGLPDKIYRAWRLGRFEIITSEYQLEEIRRASKYPKLRLVLQPAKVGTMIHNLQHTQVIKDLNLEAKTEINDTDDTFLLAMALSSGADYLVTGDYKAGILKLDSIGRTRILTAKVFYEAVLNSNIQGKS